MQKLQGDVDKFADSEAMRKAKEAYERTRVGVAVEGIQSIQIQHSNFELGADA